MNPSKLLLILLFSLLLGPGGAEEDVQVASPTKLRQELQELLNSKDLVKVYRPTPTPTPSPTSTPTASEVSEVTDKQSSEVISLSTSTPTPTPAFTATPLPEQTPLNETKSSNEEKIVEGIWVEGDVMD